MIGSLKNWEFIPIDTKNIVWKFLNNMGLKEEENSRLLNLRRKCKNFRFWISYVPGKDNTSDPISRIKDANPVEEEEYLTVLAK